MRCECPRVGLRMTLIRSVLYQCVWFLTHPAATAAGTALLTSVLPYTPCGRFQRMRLRAFLFAVLLTSLTAVCANPPVSPADFDQLGPSHGPLQPAGTRPGNKPGQQTFPRLAQPPIPGWVSPTTRIGRGVRSFDVQCVPAPAEDRYGSFAVNSALRSMSQDGHN